MIIGASAIDIYEVVAELDAAESYSVVDLRCWETRTEEQWLQVLRFRRQARAAFILALLQEGKLRLTPAARDYVQRAIL